MNTTKIHVDFNKIIGKFKPMHGVGQPPLTGISNSLFKYLKRAGIPYSRLHDVGGWQGMGLFVDIPNLFRDFDADENDPASYDFTLTDEIIKGLVDSGCEPYFRLGVTIENFFKIKAYRIYPPKDFKKWAVICEHVIRHYNEGWASGFYFGIKYWEIWNEPDSCIKEEINAMWKGTAEDYYELYSITSRHLKSCFGDSIKVGGYSSCGLHEYRSDVDFKGVQIPLEEQNNHQLLINFLHGFLKYQKETSAPIDFFTWHVYEAMFDYTRGNMREIVNHANYARNLLDHYGFTNAEHHITEWNNWCDARHRDSHIAAGRALAFMLLMQTTSTDVMCFYDAGVGFSSYKALINPDNGYPYKTYYTFMMFNTLFRLENAVLSESDDDNVYVGAAKNGKKAAVVIANNSDKNTKILLDISSFPTGEAELVRIDEENRYTLTGETLDTEGIDLPAGGCLEIKLWNLE